VFFGLKPTGRSFKRNGPLHTEEHPVGFKATRRSLKSRDKTIVNISKIEIMK